MIKHFHNPCVYTGAMVYLEDFDTLVCCDLREIDGAVMIHVTSPGNWNSMPTPDQIERATHRVSDPAGAGYVARDKSVIFVPSRCCVGERR